MNGLNTINATFSLLPPSLLQAPPPEDFWECNVCVSVRGKKKKDAEHFSECVCLFEFLAYKCEVCLCPMWKRIAGPPGLGLA